MTPIPPFTLRSATWAQMVIMDPNTAAMKRSSPCTMSGRAMNPLLCEGQIEGSVHMGLGYALTEDFPADDQGVPTNMTLRSLGIRARNMFPRSRFGTGDSSAKVALRREGCR